VSGAAPDMMDFTTLYRRHSEDVFRFAFYLCGDRATAEDIVAETFVRVWGARDRVEIATVRGYLLAIARNQYLQGRRRGQRDAILDEALPDPARPVDEAREAKQELARVLALLQELPEIDRAALLMRAEENLSYEEIAAALRLTPAAARVKVHRARARLAAAREEPTR